MTLRALEPDDLAFLYALENDPAIWGVSDTLAPVSRHALREYFQILYLALGEWPRLPSTARIERPPLHREGFASKEGRAGRSPSHTFFRMCPILFFFVRKYFRFAARG